MLSRAAHLQPTVPGSMDAGKRLKTSKPLRGRHIVVELATGGGSGPRHQNAGRTRLVTNLTRSLPNSGGKVI